MATINDYYEKKLYTSPTLTRPPFCFKRGVACFEGDNLVVFNYLSVSDKMGGLSWQSVLMGKETGVPRENHRPVASR